MAIPAYEPFIYFLIQFLVVVLGVQAWRWMSPSAWRPPMALRFSLKSLMFFMVFAALVLAVAAQLRTLPGAVWLNLVLAGIVAGLTTLIAVWLVFGKRRLRWRLVAAAIASLLLALPLVQWDEFLTTFPELIRFPDLRKELALWGIGLPGNATGWFTVLPAIVAAIAGWLGLALAAGWLSRNTAQHDPSNNLNRQRVKLLAGSALVGMSFLLALPCVALYFRLQKRPDIPQPSVARPNGYDDILAAEKMLTENNVFDSVDNPSRSVLAADVSKNRKAFERLRIGLSKPAELHLNYDEMDFDVDRHTGMRRLARALCGEGRLAELKGRYDDAAASYLDAVRLSHSVDRGGLVADWLTARAIESIGMAGLASIRMKLTSQQIDEAVRTLTILEQQREPAEVAVNRDIIWTEVAFGWWGRLYHFLQLLAHGRVEPDFARVEPAALRYQTLSRLTILELVIQGHRLKHGRLPERLEDLVPDNPWLIQDPLAADRSNSFRFVRKDDEYLLYSVGADADDDGGSPKNYGAEDGDLTLDSYFQDDEAEDTAGE